MRFCRFARYGAGVVTAGALLAGCGSGPPQAGVAGTNAIALTNPLHVAPARHPDRSRSWILPGAAKQWLIYAPDNSAGAIDIYNYRVKRSKRYGRITGLSTPYGACVDGAGDVYVVDSSTSEVYEYAHGGIAPIATATTNYSVPLGCSVDPTSGNVAVSTFNGPGSSGAGGVDIFAGGLSGSQTVYTNANLYHLYPPAYDPQGNLFVQGTDYSGASVFAELPAGKAQFTVLTGLTIAFPGSVQWDGSYLAVTDQDYNYGYTTMIYRVTVSGSQVTVVRSTQLTDNCYPYRNWMVAVQPFISGSTGKQNAVVAHNLNCPGREGFWNYTAGGLAKRLIRSAIAPAVSYGEAVSPPSSDR